MAAMASPLLEAGAIDGARGILINITGSSSLKLSEVNEASTVIQNAAHEDANIIFGAVQDESMGDEVKITVIATGFRQGESGERRERMLAQATLPGNRYEAPVSRYETPIAPRVVTARREDMPFAAASTATENGTRGATTPPAQAKVPVGEPAAAPTGVSATPSRSGNAFEAGAERRTDGVVEPVETTWGRLEGAPEREKGDGAELRPVAASVF